MVGATEKFVLNCWRNFGHEASLTRHVTTTAPEQSLFLLNIFFLLSVFFPLWYSSARTAGWSLLSPCAEMLQ